MNNEKKYAKIIVKSKYDKRGDLVLRSYVRALNKVDETRLLSNDRNTAYIYGTLDDNNRFHEFFTGEIIYFDEYVCVYTNEIVNIEYMSKKRKELMKKIVEKVLFKKTRIFLDFDITTPEEESEDHYVEFDAYENHLSLITPYPRLSPSQDQSDMMAYDSLVHKIDAIYTMRILDIKPGIDEYDINNYENIQSTGGQYVKK